ncbi:2,5-diketo-D-gluconic acid reductase A [Verticillium alfalfae VaMs.102]|uniref:2,5-diketo-D-gluconic acid reductase A n=1 Tax=Verticillium alfalfae (strain VaMs.102 / ATCC MYA-4576 / FGSC 10136) TaxID=526221 RepID=C9SSB8_VERA1|nr:2,5-diketo-D-gluconic acid reductase A [Verticillium alfalfae VaMs.102]EEY21683.1 2,5-diketo-D-gluconic acid reductase A [Verticillium alfalfae VaMs.102]
MAPQNLQSKIKLNNGYEIPAVGYGLWKTPPEQAEEVCGEALRAGYRHIDSAASYKNEAGAGAAIKKAIDISRSEIFFTSKVRLINYEDSKAQVEKTLKETGLEYIDLMLLHCPYGGSEGRKGAWKALVEAQEAGKVRSIGVSNYGVHHLDQLETHIKELEAERGGARQRVVQSTSSSMRFTRGARGTTLPRGLSSRASLSEAYSSLLAAERWGEENLQKAGQEAQQV